MKYSFVIGGIFFIRKETSAIPANKDVEHTVKQLSLKTQAIPTISNSMHRVTLLEKFWRISLYLTDNAIGKLYICVVKFKSNRGKCWKI